jgi:hypothetical protein
MFGPKLPAPFGSPIPETSDKILGEHLRCGLAIVAPTNSLPEVVVTRGHCSSGSEDRIIFFRINGPAAAGLGRARLAEQA